MVRAAVKRKRGLFAHFPDLSPDDLVQTVLIECRKDWPKFDANRASFSTWVGQVASTTLIDTWRARSRRAHNDGVYAAFRETVAGPPQIDEGDDEPRPEPTLADWLHGVYRAAKQNLRRGYLRQGRRHFSAAQAFAVTALMERMNLSVRGAVQLFESREDLRKAVHFWRVPKYVWFHQAKTANTIFLESGGE